MALSDNKTKIQQLIAGINALPEAGSGGSSSGSGTEPTLQTKVVSPSTSQLIVTPDDGYDGLSQVTVNAMPIAQLSTPVITHSNGVITASVTQTGDAFVRASTTTATEYLTTIGATTYTPGTSDQTISSGRYIKGTQTIKGDANLVPENIAEGVSIFGVTGTYAGDADVIAEQATKLSELKSILETKASGGGASVETCTVVINMNVYSLVNVTYMSIDNSGNIITNNVAPNNTSITISNVLCNSTIAVDFGSSIIGTNNTFVNVELLWSNYGGPAVFKITAEKDETATIDIVYDMGGGN